LSPNPFPQALGHLAVSIDLRHDGGEGLDASLALEARHVEMDGHRPLVARQFTDKQRLVFVDDDFACRAA